MPQTSLFEAVHLATEASAVMAFAVSGMLAAARKRLDVVGVVMVSALTAFGGGTLRDVLLDRRPFFWVEHPAWLWVLLALCGAWMVFIRGRHIELTRRAMLWPEALGLGLFAASGTQLALRQGTPAAVAVLMGVMTATFGGVLRDVVCNEIPGLFKDHRPYALFAFMGGWAVVASNALGQPDWIGLVGASALTTSLRIGALWFDWKLPNWQHEHDAS